MKNWWLLALWVVTGLLWAIWGVPTPFYSGMYIGIALGATAVWFGFRSAERSFGKPSRIKTYQRAAAAALALEDTNPQVSHADDRVRELFQACPWWYRLWWLGTAPIYNATVGVRTWWGSNP